MTYLLLLIFLAQRPAAPAPPFATEALAGSSVMMVHGFSSTPQQRIHHLLGRMEVHDPNFSAQHAWRLEIVVSHIISLLRHRGWPISEEEERLIRNAALLHDIGKLWIPYKLLHKNKALTPFEKRWMRWHPRFGWWLAWSRRLYREAEIILSHQEWIDGTGYPRHKKGDTIPLGARVIAIADAIDAMGNDRPYRPAFSRSDIVRELYVHRGTQFDTQIIYALLHSSRTLRDIFNLFGLPMDQHMRRRGSLWAHAMRAAV